MGRMSYRRLKNELGWSTTGPFKCVEQEETPKLGPVIRTSRRRHPGHGRPITSEDGTMNFDGDNEEGAGAAGGACELPSPDTPHTADEQSPTGMTRSRTDHKEYLMIVEHPDIHSYYRLFGWHGLVFMRHTVFEIDRILPSMHHDPI